MEEQIFQRVETIPVDSFGYNLQEVLFPSYSKPESIVKYKSQLFNNSNPKIIKAFDSNYLR